MDLYFLDSLKRALAALHYAWEIGADTEPRPDPENGRMTPHPQAATDAELARVNEIAMEVWAMLPTKAARELPRDFARLRRATGEELKAMQAEIMVQPPETLKDRPL